MTRNPLLNALTAAGYIVLIVSVMNYGTKLVPRPNQFMAPIAVVFGCLTALTLVLLFTGAFM